MTATPHPDVDAELKASLRIKLAELNGDDHTFGKFREWCDGCSSVQSTLNEVMQLIEQHSSEAVKEANSAGHFWKYGKQLDAYGNEGHYCNCGFAAGNAEAIKGHVQWQLAHLSPTTPGEKSE